MDESLLAKIAAALRGQVMPEPTARVNPQTDAMFMLPNYGNRYQSTDPKRAGYFGEVPRPDGDVSTELSFDFTHNGQNVSAPLMVPTLEAQELAHLLRGGAPTRAIYDKAISHALSRGMGGKDPFWTPSEPFSPLPK